MRIAGMAGAAGPAMADASPDFFTLAARKLDYIDQRQRLLAQNIANVDTPNYHPRDLSPFEVALGNTAGAPVRTNVMHLAGSLGTPSEVTQAAASRAPDGNTVDMDTQLTQVADDETSASLVSNLWKTTMGMYLTALGRGG